MDDHRAGASRPCHWRSFFTLSCAGKRHPTQLQMGLVWFHFKLLLWLGSVTLFKKNNSVSINKNKEVLGRSERTFYWRLLSSLLALRTRSIGIPMDIFICLWLVSQDKGFLRPLETLGWYKIYIHSRSQEPGHWHGDYEFEWRSIPFHWLMRTRRIYVWQYGGLMS